MLNIGSHWVNKWEPAATAEKGWTFIGWADQLGKMYDRNGKFPAVIEKPWVFTAVYSDKPVVTITAGSAEKVYDGTALTKEGFLATGLSSDYELSVVLDGCQVDAGRSLNTVVNYVITRKSDGKVMTDSFIILCETGTLVVTKRPLTIEACCGEKFFGEPDPEMKVNITGLVDGDDLDFVISRAPGEDIGEYTITVLPGNNPNYSVVVGEGVLSINDNTPPAVVPGGNPGNNHNNNTGLYHGNRSHRAHNSILPFKVIENNAADESGDEIDNTIDETAGVLDEAFDEEPAGIQDGDPEEESAGVLDENVTGETGDESDGSRIDESGDVTGDESFNLGDGNTPGDNPGGISGEEPGDVSGDNSGNATAKVTGGAAGPGRNGFSLSLLNEFMLGDHENPFAAIFINDHVAYIIGYPEGDVRPQNNITRAEAVTAFYRLLADDVRGASWTLANQYDDVDIDSWYNSSVSVMSKLGVIQGYPDGTFAPDAYITRAELTAVAARFAWLMGMENVGDATFNDISGHWAETDIANVANVGWLVGYPEGSFNPDQFITRAEFMAMTNRMLERVPKSIDDILADSMKMWMDNADPNAWYFLIVQEATNSHAADYMDDASVVGIRFRHEKWVELMEDPDWLDKEKEWREANEQ